MNRSILIVICDFLLLSLLTFSTDLNHVASDQSPRLATIDVATNDAPAPGSDLGGRLRQQPPATAGRPEAFGWARILLDFGIDRARPLRDHSLISLSERGRVSFLRSVSSRARGRPLGQRFRSGGAGAS